jgi:hypothetical protein
MTNFENRYLMTPIIDQINNTVLTLTDSITISISSKFFGAPHPRICDEYSDSPYDALTIGFSAYCLDFFCSRGLN